MHGAFLQPEECEATTFLQAAPVQVDDPPATPPPGLASVSEHARLAQRLMHFSDLGQADWAFSTRDSAKHFALHVYAPAGAHHVLVAASHSAQEFPNALLRASGLHGRSFPVQAQPQFVHRHVLYVAPAREDGVVTVLVDAGTHLICLGVPRAQAGAAILGALALLVPGVTFRLDFGQPPSLRHGDVVLARRDEALPSLDMGSLSFVARPPAGSLWFTPRPEVYVTSPSQGLRLLRMSMAFSRAHLEHAVCDGGCGPGQAAANLVRLPSPARA